MSNARSDCVWVDNHQFMDELTLKIFELVNSNDVQEQTGGLIAIGTVSNTALVAKLLLVY